VLLGRRRRGLLDSRLIPSRLAVWNSLAGIQSNKQTPQYLSFESNRLQSNLLAAAVKHRISSNKKNNNETAFWNR
jgi:hypothetical protein